MPKIAVYKEVSDAEAIEQLREFIRNIPPKRLPESDFKVGDAVRLDNGCLGVVYEFDDEGHEVVVAFDEDGTIRAPSYGWRLKKLDL